MPNKCDLLTGKRAFYRSLQWILAEQFRSKIIFFCFVDVRVCEGDVHNGSVNLTITFKQKSHLENIDSPSHRTGADNYVLCIFVVISFLNKRYMTSVESSVSTNVGQGVICNIAATQQCGRCTLLGLCFGLKDDLI